jgi:hypothetical protein
MSPRLVRRLCAQGVCILSMAMASGASDVFAEAFFSGEGLVGGNTFSDIVANPNDFTTWDKSVITYRFDPSFVAAYPDLRIEDQVRLAVTTWDNALATPDGDTYSYDRFNGPPPKDTVNNFFDIRTIALHEVGHLLGFAHPNQAWTEGPMLNFRPDGSANLIPAAPVDAVPPPPHTVGLGSEVMRGGVNPAEYNHVLSQDELDAYRRAYGRDISFQEVTGGPADILIRAQPLTDPNVLGIGKPNSFVRDANNPAAGAQIEPNSTLTFNSNPTGPIGFGALDINWDYQSFSGLPTRSIEVQTHGTNNLTPLRRWNNNNTPHVFNSYLSASAGPNAKDDVVHTWTNPLNGDIPVGQVFHVGLQQDVWDWTVTSAMVVDSLGQRSAAGMLGAHDWYAMSQNQPAGGSGTANAETDVLGEDFPAARGVAVKNSNSPTILGALGYADVTGMGLTLDNLNHAMLTQLQAQGRMHFISVPPSLQQLDAGEQLVVVFQGTAADLPADLQASGDYILVNNPSIVDRQIFLYAETTNPTSSAGTYALLNSPPITGISLSGDFNGDGKVDAADYVVWRKGLGTIYTQADYDVWRNHFGQTAGSGAGAIPNAAVPEPTTLVLLMFAATGWCVWRGGRNYESIGALWVAA